jgi:uncharacterized membrane protein YhaH (DUF805 family)
MDKQEINYYEAPKASLALDDDSSEALNTRELYNKLLTFNGRMGRIRYLYTTLAGLIMALSMSMVMNNISPFLMILALIYYAVKMPWVCAASSVRRFHDMGISGEWAWLALLPPVWIYLSVMPGQSKENVYGRRVFKPTVWEYIGVLFSLFFFFIMLLLFQPDGKHLLMS